MIRAAFPLLKDGGQGRGRTADLPFSGMVICAGQRLEVGGSRILRASSVLDHDGLGQPCGVAVLGQVGEGGGYLSVPAVNGVQVAVRGGG
jgi:hypothetical protein